MNRPRVLALATWLVVVAGVSSLVWAVISRAGDEIVTPDQPLVVASEGGRGQAAGTPSIQPSAGQPARRRTWQGPGGLIIAACDRDTIRLVSAQPVNGFHAEVKDDDHRVLEIEFEGREDRSGDDVTVVARCISGVPEFSPVVTKD